MPSLVVVAGGPERRVELADRSAVVGRAAECDLAIDEIRASRRHFAVEPTERGWVLADLESSNGTAVNGIAVSRVLLSPGDEIEVGGARIRFEDGSAPATPRAPRPVRRSGAGTGPWIGAAVAFLGVAAVTDHLVVAAAEQRAAEVDAAVVRARHAEFLQASAAGDPDAAERALEAFLRDHPAAADGPAARAALDGLRGGRASRVEAAADVEALRALRPTLDPEEYRWRLARVLHRWRDDAGAMAEIRRVLLARAPAEGGPGAPGPDDERGASFQRRREEADGALARGEFGRAVSLWTAHEGEYGGGLAVRREVARAEDAAAERADRALREAGLLRREGKVDAATAALQDGLAAVEGTASARRLRARLDVGVGPVDAAGGPGSGARGAAGDAPGGAGYEKARALLLRAAEAEQLVALRAYGDAAARLRPVVEQSRDMADVHGDLSARLADVEGVVALLDALRAAGPGSAAKPLPESWDGLAPADLLRLMETRAVKTSAHRLALAAFAYDQGLRVDAVRLVAVALQDEGTREAAGALYSRREGIAVPAGGWVGEKGEVISRDEWNRRRNREAIAKGREQQERLLKRFRESTLVRGIEKVASLRAELDKRRAHALELIFDEAAYFYPYRDRMKEYTPVQAEVDRRVAAVEEIWNGKVGFTARADGAAASIIRDIEAGEARLRGMGAEPGVAEAEFQSLKRYFDRELTVRTFSVSAKEEEEMARDAETMKANREGKTVASEPERRQVEVTNEYRIMFGRRALRIADKLVLAARAHGDDMSRGGFFSHFNEALRDPTKKVGVQACGCSSDRMLPGCSHGPDARIRQQEYEMAGCSENIHAGSGDPEGAHKGWIHSSGHHRNILTSSWIEMGTGQVGRYWTQNFGIPLAFLGPGRGIDDGGGSRWDDAGGRGTGGDGNDPRDGR